MSNKFFSSFDGRKRGSSSRPSIVMMQEGIKVKHFQRSLLDLQNTAHEDVEFNPSFLEFNEASEGITCNQRITIKNIGTKPAFIRIYQPNSMAFHVKPLKNGLVLNPGLSVSTMVTYNFKQPSFLRAVIPVEINGKMIDYQVVCKLLVEGICVEPHSIDFGFVDIGYSSGIQMITLTNAGGKSTRFSVDLGTNKMEITVKPMRGIVKPNKPTQLTVELIGMQEGEFYSEFWIKSVPNIRVPFKVKVIVPRLVIYHPNATGDFTLIDFSKTVANTRKYDSFVLRNISSQVASYVVLGEIDNELKCVRDIDRKKYPVYSAFDIQPVQGRIGPFEGIIFEVGFAPTVDLMKMRKKQKSKLERGENDFMAFLRIVRVHVTETQNVLNHDFGVQGTTSDFSEIHDKRDDMPVMGSLSSISSSSSSLDSVMPDIVRLCFHGEVQEGRLKFEPDILYFGELCVGEYSQRVVRIANPLKFASIFWRYVHNASIRCSPKSMTLEPDGSVEVLVTLRGGENVVPKFDIHFDVEASSYESQTTRHKSMIKVGSYPVHCVTKVKLLTTVKKSCAPIIYSVFDTDNKGTPIIPKKPQQITTAKVDRKIESRKDGIMEDSDYNLIKKIVRAPVLEQKTVFRKFNCDSIVKKTIPTLKTNTEVLIPLTPLQIYNVRMYPTLFSFGMVVPRSRNYRQLVVENLNEFPVMIRLANLSSRYIQFPQGNLMILPPGSLITRLVEFRASHVGKFNAYIDYIINDNHKFELAVIADIVEKQLSIDTREIIFGKDTLKEETYQPMEAAIRIRNKLGAKTYFRWEMPSNCCFCVEPMAGAVRGNSSLYTYICYRPDVTRANCTELIMKCENNSYITVKLQAPTQKAKASFLRESINLGEIPLNLPTKVIALLRNFEHFEVEYVVDHTSILYGCSVEPLDGVIPPRGITAIEISLKFNYCVIFTTTIRVTVQKSTTLQLKISGSVVFPELKLHPRSINLRRISSEIYQRYLINVTNTGTTLLKLNFSMATYPEFCISRSSRRQDSDIGNEGVLIPPGASQNFHLHFQPSDLACYVFYLPIIINDILGPSLITNSKTLKPMEFLKQFKSLYEQLSNFSIENIPSTYPTISIDCTVAKHTVCFNKLLFNFNFATNCVSDRFIVENRECVHEKYLLIDKSKFTKDCPFSINWLDGEEPSITAECIKFSLKQEQYCTFVLEFQPKSRGMYSLEAPIYVQDEMDGQMFNKVFIVGEYHIQTIHSEYSEVFFLPVPLSTPTESTFRLSTNYFDKDTPIQAKIMTPDRYGGTYNQNLLNVNFVDKNIAPAFKHSELEVKVSFLSKVAVSFRTIIEFSDDTGSIVCPVRIYATADNSLLTLYHSRIYKTSTFQWSSGYDRRVSKSTRKSGSFTEEEDFDRNTSTGQGQFSPPKISVLSYFGRRSRVSFDKLMESKFKLAGDRSEYTQEGDQSSIYIMDDLKRGLSDMDHAIDSPSSSRTSSISFKDLYDFVQYPFFPFGSDSDEYEVYMKQTLKAVQEWLYTSPFKFNYYPEIPTGLTRFLDEYFVRRQPQFKSSSRKAPELGKSFVDVLESLLGQTIYEHIVLPKSLPEKMVERASCLYTIYESILNYLIKNGALLCHVSPQFLLNYEEYVVLVHIVHRKNAIKKGTGIFPAQKKLSMPKFFSRSIQCWLDVILQTYKHLVLTRITDLQTRTESSPFCITSSRRSTAHRASIASSIISLHKYYNTHDTDIENIQADVTSKSPNSTYSSDEMFLLGWLNYHYEEQRMMDWMSDHRIVLSPYDTKDTADERKVENFDKDLSDSLVLCAVTAAYCPFIIQENLDNLYIRPRCYEEALHNAVCLVNAWRKIRLGFIITPMEIIYPNCVKMLMLVAFLFNILPTYIPKGKVKFSCSLTETVTRQISFTNPTAYNIAFLILFFENSNEFFRAVSQQSIVRLSGHKTVLVNVEYYAKKIRRTKSYLLFCGSTVGPYFSRNQTFILEGQADSLAVSSEYTICSGLYQVIDKNLTITVPYKNAAEYEIWMSEQRPTHPRTLRQTRWSELCLRKIPRRLYINQKTIVVNDDSDEASLSVTVACITPADRSFWLVFQSKLGDFIIQINSKWKASLTDNIIIEWDEEVEKCICTPNDYKDVCPLSLTIQIPSRNKQLWGCVAHMFQKTLDPKERLFWSRYLDTYIGLRLIRWLMGDTGDAAAKEFTHIFESTVTYKVTIPETPNILSIPKTFTINDVRPPRENVSMKIHISPMVEQLCEILLTLTSVGGSERRAYMISFLHTLK